MSSIDIDKLLQDISPDEPCGPNLEYDGAFQELERAAQSKPEQQFGDTIIPAEEPNWREVRSQALAVLERSRDLRPVVHLARALTHLEGWPGLDSTLELLKRMMEQQWDHLHPQLDPEDDNDPTLRVNTILGLCDAATTLRYIREAPIVQSRALGKYALRHVLVANGTLPHTGDDPAPEMTTIEAAFQDTDAEELQATAEAAGNSVAHIEAIEALLMEKVGPSHAPDLDAFSEVLKSARQVLAEQLERRGLGGGAGADAGPETVTAAPGAGAGAQPARGEITCREDAVRMIDKVCDYFERHEPSSPVPLVLRRAKRLIAKDFMQILQDLAPDGVPQAEVIRGVDTGGE